MSVPIQRRLDELLSPLGFQCDPFKISWYNAVVQPCFHLQYPDDTLAFVVLSTPQMFEKAFKPFIGVMQLSTVRDPIDEISLITGLKPSMTLSCFLIEGQRFWYKQLHMRLERPIITKWKMCRKTPGEKKNCMGSAFIHVTEAGLPYEESWYFLMSRSHPSSKSRLWTACQPMKKRSNFSIGLISTGRIGPTEISLM